jgi:hypothetical protein
MTPFTTILAVAAAGYLLYRLLVTRPVTRRDLLLPLGATLYFGSRYADVASVVVVVIILGSATFGLLTGFASGLLVSVWRDVRSGLVYQTGSWRYLGVLLLLIAARIIVHIVLGTRGISDSMLNEAFIAMALGTYLGRALIVTLRALALLHWNWEALPRRLPKGSSQ